MPRALAPLGGSLVFQNVPHLAPVPESLGMASLPLPAPGLPAAPLGSLGLQAAASELGRRPNEEAALQNKLYGDGRATSAGVPEGEIQVSRAPTWRYDSVKGFLPPAGFSEAAPGCVIAKAPPGTRFPGEVVFNGKTYNHLRNGFYIGAHASDRDIAGLFDALAPDYERKEISVEFNRRVYGGLAEVASLAREKTPIGAVLDFGSGTGVSAPVLSRVFPSSTLYAFDLSPKMRELSAQKGMVPISETRGRIELPDRSVDVAIGSFVLHLVRSSEWIQELARLLKSGGTAAFNVYKASPGWRERYGRWFEAAGLEVVSLSGGQDKKLAAELSMPVMVVRKR